MESEVLAVIQARTGSTRLPGKVLMDVSGKPMLSHVVERTRASKVRFVLANGLKFLRLHLSLPALTCMTPVISMHIDHFFGVG